MPTSPFYRCNCGIGDPQLVSWTCPWTSGFVVARDMSWDPVVAACVGTVHSWVGVLGGVAGVGRCCFRGLCGFNLHRAQISWFSAGIVRVLVLRGPIACRGMVAMS